MNNVICGDCLQVMKGMPENYFTSIVTDLPLPSEDTMNSMYNYYKRLKTIYPELTFEQFIVEFICDFYELPSAYRQKCKVYILPDKTTIKSVCVSNCHRTTYEIIDVNLDIVCIEDSFYIGIGLYHDNDILEIFFSEHGKVKNDLCRIRP